MAVEIKNQVEELANVEQAKIQEKANKLADDRKNKMDTIQPEDAKTAFKTEFSNSLTGIPPTTLNWAKEKIEERLKGSDLTPEQRISLEEIKEIIVKQVETSTQKVDENPITPTNGATVEGTGGEPATNTEWNSATPATQTETWNGNQEALQTKIDNVIALCERWGSPQVGGRELEELNGLKAELVTRLKGNITSEVRQYLTNFQASLGPIIAEKEAQKTIGEIEQSMEKFGASVKAFLEYLTSDKFMKALSGFFWALWINMSSSGGRSSTERGNVPYAEVPKSISSQEQVGQLLSQIDSLNNSELNKHKPLLEHIKKVLDAGGDAKTEEIKDLQNSLKDSDLLQANQPLYEAFTKEAFENDETQQGAPLEATGRLEKQTQLAMNEVLAKVREETTPLIAQKEEDEKEQKTKETAVVVEIPPTVVEYTSTKNAFNTLERNIGPVLKNSNLFTKTVENSKWDAIFNNIKSEFSQIGKTNVPSEIDLTDIDNKMTTITTSIDKKGTEQQTLNQNTRMGRERAKVLQWEIRELTKQKRQLEEKKEGAVKYHNQIIEQIGKVIVQITLAKKNIWAMSRDIQNSNIQNADDLRGAIDEYEGNLNTLQSKLWDMAGVHLKQLSDKTLGDKAKAILINTVIPDSPSPFYVNETMKNLLDADGKFGGDKLSTEEAPIDVAPKMPRYFPPRERVSEFTVGEETYRRRQIIENNGKLDIQIIKGKEGSHISMKGDVRNINVDIAFDVGSDNRNILSVQGTLSFTDVSEAQRMRLKADMGKIMEENGEGFSFDDSRKAIIFNASNVENKTDNITPETFIKLVQEMPINADQARLEKWSKDNKLPNDIFGTMFWRNTS